MQHPPTLTGEEITQILVLATGRYRVLYALLAGTEMRISEALGLEVGKQLIEDGPFRQQSAERAGLSFTLPAQQPAVRQLGQPEGTTKAA
ncbi:MAG: hypothetical protein LAN84_06280 [Acidobacteriia bacterium]|nr:hypothetical protein [Terriglobia bacterium]